MSQTTEKNRNRNRILQVLAGLSSCLALVVIASYHYTSANAPQLAYCAGNRLSRVRAELGILPNHIEWHPSKRPRPGKPSSESRKSEKMESSRCTTPLTPSVSIASQEGSLHPENEQGESLTPIKLKLRPLGYSTPRYVPNRRLNLKPSARWENKYIYSDLDVERASASPRLSTEGDQSARRIVVCVDASEHSANALGWCAKKLFSKYDEVHLLHIFEFEPISPMPGPLHTYAAMESVGEQNRELELHGEREAVKMMKSYQDRIAATGKLKRKPSVSVMRGACNEEICEYAENHGADLLVLSSRGLGAVKRLLLGSVSGYCVHNCKVPVLVVKENTEEIYELPKVATKSHLVQDID
mmetsp:Transcript_23170/g.40997  ORF Transcript_23170/g.40997 Transcript_23170/m.40997 type:complete len:356 (+) Transcript_23170:186-1253(+)